MTAKHAPESKQNDAIARDAEAIEVETGDKLPEHLGFAHSCAAVDRHLTIDLIFGASVGTEEVHLVGAVSIPVDALATYVWDVFESFAPQTRRLLADRGVSPQEIQSSLPGLKVNALSRPAVANLLYAYRSGTLAQLDFFYLPPKAIHEHQRDAKTNPLVAMPVCAVACDVALLGGLLDYVERNLSEFRARFAERPAT